MPVEFSNFKINDYGRPLTVENAFRFYCSFAGLHDQSFDDLTDLVADTWTDDAGLTHTSSATGEVLTGPGGEWRKALLSTDLPIDHTLYVSTTGSDYYTGFFVGAVDSDNGYLVCNEGTGVFKVYKYVSSVATLVLSVNHPQDKTGGQYICTYRPFATGWEDDDLWIQISLWRDERLILTYLEKVADVPVGVFHVGLAAYTGTARTFTDLRVPEMTVYAEYGTLDPGEAAAGGLQRAIEGRYLIYFCRYDGTVRAFRPKDVGVSLTLSNDDIYARQLKFDERELKSHVRVMGAYDWGEAASPALIATIGHRFIEINNPMLMTETECILEAGRHLKRMESEAVVCDLETSNRPLLELEDRVSETVFSWAITGYQRSYEPGATITTLALRKYVEGI